MENIKVRAMSSPWRSCVEFSVQNISNTGILNYGSYVVMEQAVHGEVISPTFKLDMDAAQCLMDDLWNCGLRPTEGTGSAGALKAVENHLQDMRKLLFKKEGIN